MSPTSLPKPFRHLLMTRLSRLREEFKSVLHYCHHLFKLRRVSVHVASATYINPYSLQAMSTMGYWIHDMITIFNWILDL